MSYFTYNQTINKIIDRYNSNHGDQLPHIPFHGLLHASASLMTADNLDIRTIMNHMGHAQASTLINIYTHGIREKDQKASDSLERTLTKRSEKFVVWMTTNISRRLVTSLRHFYAQV